MVDIYPYKKRLKSIENNIKNSKQISKENKDLIFKFRDDCFAYGVGLARVIRHFYCLRDLATWFNKSFTDAKTEDIKKLVAKVERIDRYKPRTKMEYKATLKKFYKFLRNDDNPEEVKWIKLSLKRHQEKLPTDLLIEQEITSMLNNTQSPRDRAIIITIYESGCRIGEFIKIKLRDVVFDKYGCLINVTGKTGGRRIRLVTSSIYLMDWINKHPDKENPDSFLWLKNNSLNMLEYPALCKVLRVAGKRAKIKKKFNPQNFRHSRATYLASKLTEQQLKVYLGWTRASKMAAIYVHLSNKDVNESILNIYGIKDKEKENGIPKLIPLKCIRCNFENEPTNKFCKTCGIPLNKEEAEKIIKADLERDQADNLMNKLIQDPEILELIKKKLSK